LIYAKKPTGAGGEVRVGHAVTITGFSETGSIVEVPSRRPGAPKIKMRSGGLDVIYVHDDNLGSHAHYELFDSDDVDEQGHKKLMLHRGRSAGPVVDWWPVDDWEVVMALVPKPYKLRMPISSLFEALLWVKTALETKVFPGVALHFDARFESG